MGAGRAGRVSGCEEVGLSGGAEAGFAAMPGSVAAVVENGPGVVEVSVATSGCGLSFLKGLRELQEDRPKAVTAMASTVARGRGDPCFMSF